MFRTDWGEAMILTKISKPITLKIFLGYEIRHKFYGSKGLTRDTLPGFDLFNKMLKDKVQLELDGLR